MKNVFFLLLILFIYSCETNSNNSRPSTTFVDSVSTEDTVIQNVQADTLRIILKTNEIPGDIDTSEVEKLSEPLRAIAAFYAAMGGTMCTGETCDLTTALGLGKQGSQQHKELIAAYFPNDKVAETVLQQNCYLRPSGASTFSDYEYLYIINLGDTVKVDYSLFSYNRGEETRESGPDVYLFTEQKFSKLKRAIWKFADK